MFDALRRNIARSIIIDRATQEAGSIINSIARERSEENYRFASRFVSGKSVLDIGGGRGTGHAQLLEGNPSHVLSLDLEAYSLCRRLQDARLEYRQGDFLNEPLPEGSFDVIICVGTLFYLTDHGIALARMCRLLRPGGILIINCINQDLVRKYFGMSLQSIDTKFTGAYSASEFCALLEIVFGAAPALYHQQPVKGQFLRSICGTPQLWLAALNWVFSRHPVVPAGPNMVGMYNFAVVAKK